MLFELQSISSPSLESGEKVPLVERGERGKAPPPRSTAADEGQFTGGGDLHTDHLHIIKEAILHMRLIYLIR